MGTPAFEVARGIGNNLSAAFSKVKDENVIEKILSEASQAGPEQLQGAIGKILSQVSPERQGAAVQYLQNAYANVQQKQKIAQDQAAAREAGYTYGAPPAVAAAQIRNKGPQSTPGGLSGQPVPEDTSKAISNVIQQNPTASSDELALAFDKLGVPRAYSNSYIENRRRQDEAKKPGSEFSNIREKAVADYTNNALTQGEEAENLKYSLAETRKAIKGDIAGPGLTAIAKNSPYTQILVGLTPDEATLLSANKKLLEGTKSIFGSKPTEREIFLLLNSMLPSIGKSKEANLAGLDFIERVNDLKLMHADIVSELTNGGTKYVPDLERQVNLKMRPYGESLRDDLKKAVQTFNEDTGAKKDNKAQEIEVKAPDGTVGFMSQESIDKAKENNVIFTPIKK
jgi:hypothetical protein